MTTTNTELKAADFYYRGIECIKTNRQFSLKRCIAGNAKTCTGKLNFPAHMVLEESGQVCNSDAYMASVITIGTNSNVSPKWGGSFRHN